MLKNKCFELCFKITIVLTLLRTITSVPVKQTRAASGNQTQIIVKDDLTTEFAREIIKMAKAADISAMLNAKVEPCNNFYDFACGNWHRHNPAQLLNHLTTDRFQMLAKAFDRRLEQVLREPESDDELEAKVKDFYHSCQKVKQDEVQYKISLQNIYREFGELPILLGDKWNESDFVWWETIAKIQHKYGKQIILAVDIMGDIKNNTENRIYVGPPDYTMNTNTKLLSLLQEAATMKDLEIYLGVESSLAKQTAKEIVNLERELVQGGTNERLGEALKDLLTLKRVDELNQTFNESVIDMKRYLELALGGDVPESIYVYDEKYFEHMTEIIASKPKRILANYILWQLLQEYLVDATEADLPKWCIERTKKFFGDYVDHIVYKRYKDPNMEAEVYQMWEEIRNAFRAELAGDKLDWMSNATREYAIEKLDAMELHINSYEDKNFTSLYGDLNFERLNYVESVQAILMQESHRKLEHLHEPPSSLETAEVLSFTPAYNILENKIKIPVALLQPRHLWDVNYPQALKYGTLGYLIAHEMIHGFDDEGRDYDKHGNAAQWWDAKSRYEFEERRKCFQAQYRNYKYGGRNLPDSISQSENIADNAGVKLAFMAYRRWYQNQLQKDDKIRKTEMFHTLTFEGPQMFFVGFAQLWCDDVQSLFQSSVASADTHAPSKYRVIGSLSNFQEFSWLFGCDKHAPMDPDFKCAIY